jgi:hypothetical protein
MGTWGRDIGEYAGWSAEDIVLKLYPFIDRNIVLDADAVPYFDIVGDIYILSKRAFLTEGCTLLHVAEVPYFGPCADSYILIDVA